MTQHYTGFNARSAPGAAAGPVPAQAQAPAKNTAARIAEIAEEDQNTRISSSGRQMLFGLIEIVGGIASNIGQTMTTFYSFIQLQLGLSDTTLRSDGPLGGLLWVARYRSADLWVALAIALGTQILMQAGCQVVYHKWKRENITENQESRVGIVQVWMHGGIGKFFTGLGFIGDAVGDIGFVFAFGIPWYVCILFGLILNGLSTFGLYDGDERFHAAYLVWWRFDQAKKLWKQAALEKARLLQGMSRDGKSLQPYTQR